MNKISKIIHNQISENPILLYMKGTPDKPKCGFSYKAYNILYSCYKNFLYIDVLSNIDIKNELPIYSKWPTFPQLWINKKLIGGYDIMFSMYKTGELQKLINYTINKLNI